MNNQKPTMSGKQKREAARLIQSLCANYDEGRCIYLDDSFPWSVCPQLISNTVLCQYFVQAVLPTKPELEAEIFSNAILPSCKQCGQRYVRKHHNQMYCSQCAAQRKRRQNAESEARRRLNRVKSSA